MPDPPVFSAIQSSKTVVETSSTEPRSESTKQPRCNVTASSESNHVLRFHFYYQPYSIEPSNQQRVSRKPSIRPIVSASIEHGHRFVDWALSHFGIPGDAIEWISFCRCSLSERHRPSRHDPATCHRLSKDSPRAPGNGRLSTGALAVSTQDFLPNYKLGRP
jgi:hypothetical protein